MSERSKRTLYISQPIIFQSKVIPKSEFSLPSELQKPSRFSSETQKFGQHIGDETKIFFQKQEQIGKESKLLKIFRPQQQSEFLTQQQTQSMYNIFEEANNEDRKKYIDCNGGPRFESEKQDKVVKWSVVGHQQFLKIHSEKQKLYAKHKKTQLTTGTEDSLLEDQPPLSKTNFNTQQIILDPRNQQQARKTPKKNRGDQKVMNKRALGQQMREISERIENNKQEAEVLESKLPLHLRNALSREERAIKTFQNTQTSWENIRTQVAANCFRKPEETIMQRSDQFRERNQMIEALEQCKGDDEKCNSRYWYLRLRWYDHKDSRPPFSLLTQSVKTPVKPKFENRLINRFISDSDAERLYQQPQFVLSDIQANFNAKLIDNPFKQVETVITEASKTENNLGKHQNSEMSSPKSKLYSSRLETMYHQKIKEKPKKKFIDVREFMSLTGESQFKREKAMLQREEAIEFRVVDIPQEQPEVIASNWDQKNLARSGEHPLI